MIKKDCDDKKNDSDKEIRVIVKSPRRQNKKQNLLVIISLAYNTIKCGCVCNMDYRMINLRCSYNKI